MSIQSEQRPRVLVVDDHPTNRKLLQVVVEEMGWTCVSAEDGAAALAACGAEAFDLILMDYRMPGMDGCETTMAIRALGGWAAAAPIIGITAEDSQAARAKCIASGMLTCIGKPIQPLAVTALMRRTLEINPPEASPQRHAFG